MSQDISTIKNNVITEEVFSIEETLGQPKIVQSAQENSTPEYATWDNANTTWTDATWENIKPKI